MKNEILKTEEEILKMKISMFSPGDQIYCINDKYYNISNKIYGNLDLDKFIIDIYTEFKIEQTLILPEIITEVNEFSITTRYLEAIEVIPKDKIFLYDDYLFYVWNYGFNNNKMPKVVSYGR